MKMDVPNRYLCPITFEPMQQPTLHTTCSNNFEETAILAVLDDGRSCPLCRDPLTRGNLVLNRALREQIQEWLHQVWQPQPVGEGEVLVAVAEPRCALFIGKMGSGKSKTINTIVGREVTVARASAQGVTQGPVVAFNGILREGGMESAVKIVDSKGLFDPSSRNEETLAHLTQMLLEGVAGVDMIVHVIKLGRLDDNEIETPNCILHGLATDNGERARLARRYRIVVTHCDSHADDLTEEQARDLRAEFRGALRQTFPLELEPAVENCLFVENNLRLNSDFNNPNEICRWFLNQLGTCRENRAIAYRPKLLTDVLEGSRASLHELCMQQLSPEALRDVSENNLHAIIQFFRFVQTVGKWHSPRPTDQLPQTFVAQWNALNRVGRDSVALEIAEQALVLLQRAAQAAVDRAALERQKKEQEAAERLAQAERALDELQAEADRLRRERDTPRLGQNHHHTDRQVCTIQ